MSEWLEFVELPNEGYKTKKFQVVSKKHGYPLGDIKFYNKWRNYCFYPAPDTIFSNGCLKGITEFIRNVKRHC